jgi:hypothetical protein
MDDIRKIRLVARQIQTTMDVSKHVAAKATDPFIVVQHKNYADGIAYALFVLHLWFPDDIATPYEPDQPNSKPQTSN